MNADHLSGDQIMLLSSFFRNNLLIATIIQYKAKNFLHLPSFLTKRILDKFCEEEASAETLPVSNR